MATQQTTAGALELNGLTIGRAGALLRQREVSPTELTQAYLRRIERLQPELNAYITLTAERALEDARGATDELAQGTDRGPLHGIPIGLKDLYDTAGILTTGGARFLADRVPTSDSTVSRKLREAGTVLLGKLNTHELAWGVTTNNPHFGPTRNPWRTDHIPGGSSGGSGAAIAAGLAVATMGTDTGGSIRIPASLCGVVGLKPTYGRVSKAGVLPLSWLFDHTGPITRTVEDAALMLQAIAGYDPDDFSTLRAPIDDYLGRLGGGVRGLRVGVPRAYFYDRLDDEVRAAIETALEVLRGLGAEIRDVDLSGFDAVLPGLVGIAVAESKEYHARALRERPIDFGPDVGAILGQDAPDGVSLAAGLRGRQVFAEAARRVLEQVDVLVTPTTPLPAVPIGQEVVAYGGVEEPVLFAMIRCTLPFNAAQLPALSVPCGFTRAGLPIGLQIAGRPLEEAVVLRVGHTYEQATDWHQRRPSSLAG